MRKNIFVTAALVMLTVSAAYAQFNSDGYYRVQNSATQRYVGIIHNRSESQVITTQADLAALRAYKDWNWVESDPATIIYFEKRGENKVNGKKVDVCNLYGQGTSTRSITNYDINLVNVGGKYRCYVQYQGTQYLSERSASSTAATNRLDINTNSTWNWNILPVSSAGSCYFGVKPTVEAQGKYYATMYADWGFTPASSSTKAYYVEKVANGYAVIREITGEVPAKTPVIFECAGEKAVDNKLDISKNNAKLPTVNKLNGVYFCIDNGQSFHRDSVTYNPAIMRVLGVCSDGRPGFVKKCVDDFVVEPDFKYFKPKGAIPANTAYLVVPEGTPDELPLVTAEEYAAGINDVTMSPATSSDVVTLSGVVVKRNATSVEGLPSGIYIWNKRKIVVR